MEWFTAISVFILSCGVLYISGELVVSSLIRLSQAARLSSFTISFLVMGVAASLPNLIIGIQSAFKGVPELSLGDVFGNNLVALTLAAGLGVLFSKTKTLEVGDTLLRKSVIFTAFAAILPLFIIYDHELSRIDGAILMALFVFYLLWIFLSKHKPINKEEEAKSSLHEVLLNWTLYKALFKVILGVILLIGAAQAIIFSASFFALELGLPLVLIGLLVVGFGNALPEVYFAVASARRGQTDIILGNLLGSVIVPATFVLGTVALIHPINTEGVPFLFLSRIFLFATILIFLAFSRKGFSINKTEAWILISLYFVFIISAVFFGMKG